MGSNDLSDRHFEFKNLCSNCQAIKLAHSFSVFLTITAIQSNPQVETFFKFSYNSGLCKLVLWILSSLLEQCVSPHANLPDDGDGNGLLWDKSNCDTLKCK